MTTKLDNQLLAERYDQVSEGQFKNGLILIEKLGVKKGQNVLDIGCGTGRLTLLVAKKISPGGSVVGIDPSLQRIKIAQKKNQDEPVENVSFEVSNSNDLDHFKNDSFDIVYLNIVLHWIQEKEDAFDQIYRVLKPGGRLGITTGNKDKPYTVKSIMEEVLRRPRYAGAVKADIMKELEKKRTPKGIENLYNTIFAVAKK